MHTPHYFGTLLYTLVGPDTTSYVDTHARAHVDSHMQVHTHARMSIRTTGCILVMAYQLWHISYGMYEFIRTTGCILVMAY